jgi:hypothetical protein
VHIGLDITAGRNRASGGRSNVPHEAFMPNESSLRQSLSPLMQLHNRRIELAANDLERAASFVIPICGKKACCDENAKDTKINNRTGKPQDSRLWLGGNPVNWREESQERIQRKPDPNISRAWHGDSGHIEWWAGHLKLDNRVKGDGGNGIGARQLAIGERKKIIDSLALKIGMRHKYGTDDVHRRVYYKRQNPGGQSPSPGRAIRIYSLQEDGKDETHDGTENGTNRIAPLPEDAKILRHCELYDSLIRQNRESNEMRDGSRRQPSGQ